MTTANARTGTSGYYLVGGFDIHGGGLQVEQNSVYSGIEKVRRPTDKWKKLRLVNLMNSSDDKINLLAKSLEAEGHSLYEICYFNKVKNVYFVTIDAIEYRIKNRKIVKIKSKKC